MNEKNEVAYAKYCKDYEYKFKEIDVEGVSEEEFRSLVLSAQKNLELLKSEWTDSVIDNYSCTEEPEIDSSFTFSRNTKFSFNYTKWYKAVSIKEHEELLGSLSSNFVCTPTFAALGKSVLNDLCSETLKSFSFEVIASSLKDTGIPAEQKNEKCVLNPINLEFGDDLPTIWPVNNNSDKPLIAA